MPAPVTGWQQRDGYSEFVAPGLASSDVGFGSVPALQHPINSADAIGDKADTQVLAVTKRPLSVGFRSKQSVKRPAKPYSDRQQTAQIMRRKAKPAERRAATGPRFLREATENPSKDPKIAERPKASGSCQVLLEIAPRSLGFHQRKIRIPSEKKRNAIK